jgi:hypothetical protein
MYYPDLGTDKSGIHPGNSSGVYPDNSFFTFTNLYPACKEWLLILVKI